jgi:hypothetical protein
LSKHFLIFFFFSPSDNVELEIVLPGQLTVIESHDVALALQHKIESLPDVERAFVHVDHQRRDGLEHKIERELVKHAIQEGSLQPSPVERKKRSNSRDGNDSLEMRHLHIQNPMTELIHKPYGEEVV